MSIVLDISAESKTLYVVATGDYSLDEAKRATREVLEAVALNYAGKVLVDGLGIVGNPKFMERINIGKFTAQTVMNFKDRGVSHLTQFALVLEVPMLDPERLGENVARSRGMNFKVFDNLSDAHGWLGIAPLANI